MNVKRIIVDELPESCNDCDFLSSKFINNYSVCNLRNERIPEIFIENPGIPDLCPLELEEVCEWHLPKEPVGIQVGFETHYFDMDGTFIASCNQRRYKIGSKSLKFKYQFCPNCGKRIKYVEVE